MEFFWSTYVWGNVAADVRVFLSKFWEIFWYRVLVGGIWATFLNSGGGTSTPEIDVPSPTFRGPIFFQVSPHTKKIPLPPLGRSYSDQKNHFAICRNSERCCYHTDWSRFVLPICDPSALNFSQFVGFQDSPNLSKIEKVAETCEFDGKEPLFVERTIAISNRVLGWKSTGSRSQVPPQRAALKLFLFFESRVFIENW